MKIALVVALGGDLVRSTEHVGIGYIAACLRQSGHTVAVYEVPERLLLNEDGIQSNFDWNVDIVGFTTTCVTIKYVIKIARQLKRLPKAPFICCGGHMATFAGEELLEKYDCLDCMLYGEGELTFVALADCLEQMKDLTSVAGIAFRVHGKVKRNKLRPLIENLDELPFPDRDQFEQHHQKFQYLRLSTSRGCLGNCAFCSSHVGRKQKGKRWRGRSPNNVVDEIEFLVNKYQFHTYDFVDSTFEDPGEIGKNRIRELANEIIRRKLHIFYNCCFRAENWGDSDRELLKILVASGLEKVNIGFESGNDHSLEVLNKNANMEDNWRVLKLLAEFPEIYITFGFIMLHPYSCKQDLRDNAAFLHSTGIGQVIRHYFWVLEIYPDTLMEKKLKKDGLLAGDYTLEDGMYRYHFLHPEMKDYLNMFQQFLKVQSVWDFEIFDIIIHTFTSRLMRAYKNTPVINEIMEFHSFVNEIRKEMAEFNYTFFLKLLANNPDYSIELESNRLDAFIRRNMEKINHEQFILGMKLKRRGFKVEEIR